MYQLIRNLLFLLSPETAHHVTFKGLRLLMSVPFIRSLITKWYFVSDPYMAFGLNFPNRVGLAAGLDKNAEYLPELKALGFGFVEIGTVTPRPQPGNDRPRLFRLRADECLINRMGFNNDGVEVIANRLRKRPKGLIVGGNIGKNKVTPNEEAVNDYLLCFEGLYDVVDYFVVNVSSPNTPNLRELQDKGPLLKILTALVEARSARVAQGMTGRPILLKIAPDLATTQLDDVVEIVKQSGIDGMVATNTTLSREGLITPGSVVKSIGAGGLSGKILQQRATEVLQMIRKKDASVPVIGVGGIHDADSAAEKIQNGAVLIQLYTGFIYGGPPLVKRCANALKNLKLR